MRGRRHVGEVELGDLRDGVEDRVQLIAETLDLLVREVEMCERRDVENLFSRDRHVRWILETIRAPFGALTNTLVPKGVLRSGDVRGLCALGALHDLERH